MSDSALDLDIGDTTDPYVPTPIPHESTQVFARPTQNFARPSSQYPLAVADLDEGPTHSLAHQDPTTVWDPEDRSRDEVPTVNGKPARTYPAYDELPTKRAPQEVPIVPIARVPVAKRAVPPPIPPRRARRLTPVELDDSYRAAIRRFR